MDSLLDDSAFGAGGGSEASSDFEPPVKITAKAAPKPKKPAASKAAPKKTTQTTLKPTKTKPAPKKRAKPMSDDEDEDISLRDHVTNDDSVLSHTPPSAKKQKKAPAPKKAAGKPLAPVENEVAAFDGAAESKSKSASDRYQKLTQLEHIIKRPDTYIGSVEHNEKQMWVYNSEKESMELRDVSFVPGLYKIFDEILVNAADNKSNDKNMDTIKVSMDKDSGEISVWNNGHGIPIQIHKKENIYIPEMIFGHLLTGSNYDDDEQKVTGGRNGYGAKLCNIFSTKFTIETADSKTKQKYKQTWTDNMSKMGKATITTQKGSDDYTKVTFTPDWKYFKMDGIDDDFEALVKRRVYDVAGALRGVKVYLNGDRIKTNSFKAYMEMYTKAIKAERGEEAAGDLSEIVTDTDKSRWEIGFAVSDGSFQQVSFVNSIATTSGGTHVNYIADQICNKLIDIVKKKKDKSGAQLKPGQIRNHLFVFVNAQIVNPAFTSQTKEQLTTKQSQFGSKFQVTDEFMKKIVSKTQVVANIMAFAQQKADQILKKSDGARRSRMDNPKLTDANKAGTKDGWQCTLILTEGDSAKGLAMQGRSIVGPDLFGVFPLRGKLLNVRDASIDQISKNAEIQNIKNILGLKHKQTYNDCKSLRYGHIMIMTDQDHDGSHIKGLLINFLQVQYPSLLKIPQFLIEFITPIAKVIKGDPKKPTKSHMFFTMPEYETWKEAHKNERTWEHKYYKGLGTSSDEDGERYFRDLDRHLKEFHAMQEHEPELIELAFSKKKADERKEWLRQYRPGTFLDHTTRDITYQDFVNKELILFSMADNVRSIPSIVDGFKPGQRKVLFTCLKRNLKKDMKVVELAGHVLGVTAYHHGENSLQQTIIGMAQTFVGSNNVNTLEPSGNFGSRLQGGSDAASARYIFTRLSPFARKVFHQLDEPLLKHNVDDDKIIEPEVYVPVVPMVLINGADGIGTGWSTSIPNYNPKDIVDNLKRMMRGEEPEAMTPWFRDFEGAVEKIASDRYKISGIITQTGDNELEVRELPIRMWTQDFKDRLVDVIKAEKAPSWIKDYDDYNTKQKVNFVIRMEDKHMQAALNEGLEERFKIVKTMATSNLVAFDAQGRITKYANVEEILKAFYDVRIKFYEKRKAYQLAEMNSQLEKLTNQARFVQMIIDGKLTVSKKKKRDLVTELKEKNFKPFPKIADATKDGEVEPAMEDKDDDEEVDTAANAYDYLLGMAIWSLTKERVEKLLKQIGDKQLEIDDLIKLSKEDLWNRDLDGFIQEWECQLEEDRSMRKKVHGMKRRVSSKLRTQVNPGRKRKGGEDGDDSDFGAAKKLAKKAKPQENNLLGYLAQPKESAPTKKVAEAKSKPKPKSDDFWMNIDDNSSDIDLAAVSAAASKSKTVPTKPPAVATAATPDSDSDAGPTAARGARRVAARKPVNYGALTDSELDSDGDFDVGKMVKGIGENSSSATTSRPLFAASATTSRPGSSHGLAAARKSFTMSGRPSMANVGEDGEGEDETDYTRLAPSKAATAKAAAIALSDDEDITGTVDLDGPNPVAAPKPAPAATATAAANGVKKRGRPAAATSKPKGAKEKEPKAKAADSKRAKAAGKPDKKQPTLSPAAKAYAAKQKLAAAPASSAPSKPAAASRSKNVFSDESDNEDVFVDAKDDKGNSVEKLADEILSDDEDDEDDDLPVLSKGRAKGKDTGARTAKQAAAPKPKPKAAASAPAPKAKAQPKAKGKAAKRAASEDEDELDAMNLDGADDDDDDDDDDIIAAPTARAGGVRPARRAAAAAVKKAWIVDDDEDDEDDGGVDESELVVDGGSDESVEFDEDDDE